MLYVDPNPDRLRRRFFHVFYVNWAGPLIRECALDDPTRFLSTSHHLFEAGSRGGRQVVVGPPVNPELPEVQVEHRERVEEMRRLGVVPPDLPTPRIFGPPIALVRRPDRSLAVDVPLTPITFLRRDVDAFNLWPLFPPLPTAARDRSAWLVDEYRRGGWVA
jgi:hypothetical protein